MEQTEITQRCETTTTKKDTFYIDENEGTSLLDRFFAFWRYHGILKVCIVMNITLFFIFFLASLENDLDVLLPILAAVLFFFIIFNLSCLISYFTCDDIIFAARGGYLDVIEKELAKGVNVNLTYSFRKSTPIFDAVSTGSLKTVRFLVERGADIMAYNNEGLTLLHFAKTPKMVKYLLHLGCKIDETRNHLRRSPLNHAICLSRLKVAQCLVEEGADVNLVSKDGMNALAHALKYESLFCRSSKSLIEAILIKGGDAKHSFSSWCIPYESCQSYALVWSSPSINALFAKFDQSSANV